MDTEKQKSSPGGTVPGEKVPPVLMAEDVAALEELCGDVSGYFYKMLDYLDQRVRDGVRQGEFTEEQARGDLDLALWYAYACNNIDDYDYYYKAAQWMPASEPAAEAAGSGIWYYRYACALMYCGRLEEARHYAETGVSLDPEYPWGWLETAKLRAHFGDASGALEAVDRGLALVPGDYEFTTLRREIQEGRTLEEMEFHWIDPECDAVLQAGGDENEAEKRLSIAGICCDPENLAAIKAALSPTEWEADAPYCTFQIPYQGGSLLGRFFMNRRHCPSFPSPGSGSWCAGCRSWTAGAEPSWPPRRGWERRDYPWNGSRSIRTGRCACVTSGGRTSRWSCSTGISPFAARTGSPP